MPNHRGARRGRENNNHHNPILGALALAVGVIGIAIAVHYGSRSEEQKNLTQKTMSGHDMAAMMGITLEELQENIALAQERAQPTSQEHVSTAKYTHNSETTEKPISERAFHKRRKRTAQERHAAKIARRAERKYAKEEATGPAAMVSRDTGLLPEAGIPMHVTEDCLVSVNVEDPSNIEHEGCNTYHQGRVFVPKGTEVKYNGNEVRFPAIICAAQVIRTTAGNRINVDGNCDLDKIGVEVDLYELDSMINLDKHTAKEADCVVTVGEQYPNGFQTSNDGETSKPCIVRKMKDGSHSILPRSRAELITDGSGDAFTTKSLTGACGLRVKQGKDGSIERIAGIQIRSALSKEGCPRPQAEHGAYNLEKLNLETTARAR